MSLLGEEVVEEWLNRNGYFTIRGIKVGVDEIDILAIKPLPSGRHECRHIEIQLSVNPISYITKVPKALQKERGVGPHNAKKRGDEELAQGVREWIAAKFDQPRKIEIRQSLCPGNWSRELVVGNVKHEEEIALFKQSGISVHRLSDVLSEMTAGNTIVRSAAGADLFDLMQIRK